MQARETPYIISHRLSRRFCYTLHSPVAIVYASRGELPYKSMIPDINPTEAISPDVVTFSDNLCEHA